LHRVNGRARQVGGLVISGAELEEAVRSAMRRNRIGGIRALARRAHLRPDTIYGWFNKDEAVLARASLVKLTDALGAEPGDPWHDEPAAISLSQESLEAIDGAVSRSVDRAADRIEALIRELLARDGQSAAS
jgi:hypothetical protein